MEKNKEDFTWNQLILIKITHKLQFYVILKGINYYLQNDLSHFLKVSQNLILPQVKLTPLFRSESSIPRLRKQLTKYTNALQEADRTGQELRINSDHKGAENKQRKQRGKLGRIGIHAAIPLEQNSQHDAQAHRPPQVPVPQQQSARLRKENVSELVADGLQVAHDRHRHRLVQG